MDEEFFKHLWAYAVKIQFDDQFVIFYRKYTNGKVLKSGTFDALLFQAGRFSQIESTVFQIDNNIDTFCLGQELIILQNTNFERIFGFDDHYEASSGAALQQIAAAHDFVDINLLTEYVGTDSRKKRKLAAISKNQLIANLGFEQIKETIQNYSLEISIDDQNRKFELTRDNAFVFLKALNDDYLRSEATSTRYEASSKRKRR
nr:Kiwa anti-phage protein KwaB-like domain-containing protein [Paenibacillus sp. MMS18-CY102]